MRAKDVIACGENRRKPCDILQLALGHAAGAGAPICMAVSLVCGLLALNGIRRVKSIDKFEKEIRGG